MSFKKGQRAVYVGSEVMIESGPDAQVGRGGLWFFVRFLVSGSVALVYEQELSRVVPRKGDRVNVLTAGSLDLPWTIYAIDEKYVVLEQGDSVIVRSREAFDRDWRAAP